MSEEKSHVGMVYRLCPITGEEWETGEILLDKKMKKSLKRKNIVGYGFAPKVQEQLDKGFVVLLEIDPNKSKSPTKGNTLSITDVYKTGRLIYLKKQVAKDILGIKDHIEMSFIDKKVFEFLENLQKKNEGDSI